VHDFARGKIYGVRQAGHQLRIGKKLGEGQEGSVFAVEHGVIPTRFAVKFHTRRTIRA
jgi:ribosomal protein L27